MIFGKLLKTGSIALSGVLIGGIVTYSSQKLEIVDGVEQIANAGISAKKQASDLEVVKTELEKNVGELKIDIDDKVAQIGTLTTEKGNLEIEKTKLEGEKKELEDKGIADTKIIEELGTQISQLTTRIDDSEEQLRTAKLDLQELTTTLETKNARITELEESMKNYDLFIADMYTSWGRQVEELNGEIKNSTETINAKDAQIVDLKAKLKEANLTAEENENLKAQIEALTAEKSQIERDLQAQTEEVDRLTIALNGKDTEIGGLKDKLTNLTTQWEDLYKTLGRTTDDANSKIEEANGDQEAIMDAIKDAKVELGLE